MPHCLRDGGRNTTIVIAMVSLGNYDKTVISIVEIIKVCNHLMFVFSRPCQTNSISKKFPNYSFVTTGRMSRTNILVLSSADNSEPVLINPDTIVEIKFKQVKTSKTIQKWLLI